jgi:hypothetical protein
MLLTIVNNVGIEEYLAILELFELTPCSPESHVLTPLPSSLLTQREGQLINCILINSPSLRGREGEYKGMSTCYFLNP